MRRALSDIENVCLHAEINQCGALIATRLDKELQVSVQVQVYRSSLQE